MMKRQLKVKMIVNKNELSSFFIGGSMKKNDYIDATCIDYTHDAFGVVKVDGFPVFVKNMLVGESGKIKIIKVLKNYGIGRLISLDNRSDFRVPPVCPIFKQCGGCQLQHMTYDYQLYFKTKRVKDTLKRIGHCDCEVSDCIGMDEGWFYRNKIQVPIGRINNNIVMGFYKQHSNEIIPMEKCYIQSEDANIILKRILELFNEYHIEPFDRETHKGCIKHVMIREGYYTKEVMIAFISTKKKVNHLFRVVNKLKNEFPMIRTIILNINNRKDNVIIGEEEILLYGDGYIKDQLLGLDYKISLKSFYQINPIQVEKLYTKAIELANLDKDDIVIDAYCGIGTIGLSLADKVKKVIGIEIVEDAINDARENAMRNNINNIEFHVGDAGEFMTQYNGCVDVVMVDPPRKGCSNLFLEQMISLSPKKVIYISCNVATQSRDIEYLESNGYKAKVCECVDMFPQTKHVETVVLMSRK